MYALSLDTAVGGCLSERADMFMSSDANHVVV